MELVRRSRRFALVLAALLLTAGWALVTNTARGGDEALSSAGLHCGIERWPVKTLSDPAADEVDFTPRQTTVTRLTALRKPTVGRLTPRMEGVEKRTYRLRAELVEAKHLARDDRDIHLVIASPRGPMRTMIVEFPDVRCSGAIDSLKKEVMRRARASFLKACGDPSTSGFTDLVGTATVTGVGFFDKIHGQRGRAPNGIELHPVLRFVSNKCQRQ
jgi:hypothetical protein